MSATRWIVVLPLLVVSLGGAACVPGRCEGGFRKQHSPAETGVRRGERFVVPAQAVFIVNSDSDARTVQEVAERSGVGPDALFLEGPAGRVPAEIEAHVHTSAHSCASAASFTLRPQSPLSPGDYTLVLLLDSVRWPAISSSDVAAWRGRKAMLRSYRVE